MRVRERRWAVAAGILVLEGALARAAPIPVENPSFESPAVPFAAPGADNWSTDGPVIDPGCNCNLNTGVFLNPGEGDPGRIHNAEGNQLAFVGTETGNEFTQMLNVAFEPGRSYVLTVAVAHSFFAPKATDRIVLALFYRDAEERRQVVASTDVFNDAAAGLSTNVLLDFSAISPVLDDDHPAVGQPIGVLLTTIGEIGGFFDLDSVRVESFFFLDADRDDDLDAADVDAFLVCVSGPAIPVSPGCARHDLDGDGDVDQKDFGIVQCCYTGPAGILDPDCVE